jgi:hypothetical protein
MPQNHQAAPARAGKRGLSGVAAAAALLVALAAFASFGPANLLFAQADDASAPALQDAYGNSFLMSDAPAAPAPAVGDDAGGKVAPEAVPTTLRKWNYTFNPTRGG